MVMMCCVKSCRSEAYLNCGISFHRFPKDEQMRAKWVKAVGGKLTCKNPFICSLHFKKRDYKTTTSKRRLNADAVPYVEELDDESSESSYETEVVKAEDTAVAKAEETEFVKVEETEVVKTEKTVVVKKEKTEVVEAEETVVIKAENTVVVKTEQTEIVESEETEVVGAEETVVVKAEPDEFTEEEDDLMEKLEKKRQREEEATQTELKKPKLDSVYINRKISQGSCRKKVSSTPGCDKNVEVSEIFMKTMPRTEKKTQMLTQNPDLKQLTFLRFLDAEMQKLPDQRREELRDKITQIVLQESNFKE